MFVEGEVVVNSWWSNIFGLYLLIVSARIIQIIVDPDQFHFEFYWQHLLNLNCFSYKKGCIDITTNTAVESVLSVCFRKFIFQTHVIKSLSACWPLCTHLLLLLLSRFSRVWLCNPIEGSPPGFPVASKKVCWGNLALHLYLFN